MAYHYKTLLLIMKTYNLSSIMSEAHRISRITGMSMSESLKRAWLNEKLNISMRTRICHFYYKKVSGEIREAYGTRMPRYTEGTVQGTGRTHKDCFTYYDTIADGWRSFKTYNIISIN